MIGNQHALKEQINRYVSDEETAGRLAWLVHCSLFGYQQIFAKLEVAGLVDMNMDEYGGFMTEIVGRGVQGEDKVQGR